MRPILFLSILALFFSPLSAAVPALAQTGLPTQFTTPAQPEEVLITDLGGVSGFELHRPPTYTPWQRSANGSIYWCYTAGLPSCSGEFPNSAHVRWRAKLLDPTATIANDCEMMRAGNSSAARLGSYMYFFRGTQLYRKSLNSGSINLPLLVSQVPALPADAPSSPLAADAAGRLYFAVYDSGNNRSTIYRFTPDSGSSPAFITTADGPVTAIKPFSYSVSFTLTEAIAFIAGGVLYRWHPDGLLGSKVVLANGVTAFAIHTYTTSVGSFPVRLAQAYAAAGNTLLRVNASSQASVTLYTASGDNLVVGVATDSDGLSDEKNVYLAEAAVSCSPFCAATDVTLRRRSITAASNAPWDLILATNGGTNLRSDNAWLYYIPNPNNNPSGLAIHRIATDTPAIQIDLATERLEVNQALNNLNHDFFQIADRPTLVRGYVRVTADTTNTNQYPLSGRLVGKMNGVTLPGSPLTALEYVNVTNESDLSTLRGQITRTLTFELPESWVNYNPPSPGFPAQLTLELSVNPTGDPPETVGADPYANNSTSLTVLLLPRPRPCLLLNPVYATVGPVASYPEALPEILARARSLMPVKNFRVWERWESDELALGYIYTNDGDPYSLIDSDGRGELLGDMAFIAAFSDEPSNCFDTHWAAMVHPETPMESSTGSSVGGVSRGDIVLLFKVSGTDLEQPYNSERGGLILAHEMGHQYGRDHIACGSFPPDQQNFDDVPYNDCELSFTVDMDHPSTMYGIDPLSRTAIPPDQASDVMSYSYPKWASLAYWNNLVDLIPTSGQLAQQYGPQAPALLAHGVINETNHTGQFNQMAVLPQPAHKLSAPAAPLDGSAYILRLLDAGGLELSSTAVITEHTNEHAGAHILNFAQWLPFPAGARKIELWDGAQKLAEKAISANAPVINLQPLQIDALAESLHARWTAFDPDGDPLIFTLQYSADNGATWLSLLTGLSSGEITLSTAKLPASNQARLRVLAGDGVLTTPAVSEAFTVAPHAPQAVIGGLIEGERLEYGAERLVQGLISDPEDLSLDGSQMVWRLSGPASLVVTGTQLSLANLPPGSYELSLSGTDSGGLSGSTTRSFEVLPLVVPDAPTPAFDGFCLDQAYLQAAEVRLPGPTRPSAHLMHAGGYLYACFRDLPILSGSGKYLAGLRVDADASGEPLAQPGDTGFFVDESGLYYQAAGNGAAMPVTLSPQGKYEAFVQSGPGGWSAELRFGESLVGGWNHAARLLFQSSVSSPGDNTFNWPAGGGEAQPATWAAAYFGTPPTHPNRAPTAATGADLTWAPGSAASVGLDGSPSFDPDGDALTYQWTQTSGPAAVLSGANTVTPTLSVTPVAAPVTLTFRLVVNDGLLPSPPAEMAVTLLPPPAAANRRLFLPILAR